MTVFLRLKLLLLLVMASLISKIFLELMALFRALMKLSLFVKIRVGVTVIPRRLLTCLIIRARLQSVALVRKLSGKKFLLFIVLSTSLKLLSLSGRLSVNRLKVGLIVRLFIFWKIRFRLFGRILKLFLMFRSWSRSSRPVALLILFILIRWSRRPLVVLKKVSMKIVIRVLVPGSMVRA